MLCVGRQQTTIYKKKKVFFSVHKGEFLTEVTIAGRLCCVTYHYRGNMILPDLVEESANKAT